MTEAQVPPPDPAGRRSAGPAGALVDLVFRQGAGSRPNVTPASVVPAWRPPAAGFTLAVGGIVAMVMSAQDAELIDVVLALGITLFVAGLVDGTGRRYRGAGMGVMLVGIVPRHLPDPPASWFASGGFLGAFLLAWGLYAAAHAWLAERAHRRSAA